MSTHRTPRLPERPVQLPSLPDRLLTVTQGDGSWEDYTRRFKRIAYQTEASNRTKIAYYLRGLKKELAVRVLKEELPDRFRDLLNLTRKHVKLMEYERTQGL